MRVREVFVVLGFAINNDLFLKEFLVDGAIEDVSNNVAIITGVGGMPVSQLFCEALVLQHHLELILHR